MWIARNLDGGLNLYLDRPTLEKDHWVGCDSFKLPKTLNPNVIYGNSPQEVDLMTRYDKEEQFRFGVEFGEGTIFDLHK